MNLEFAFQLSVYLLTALAGGMLAFGEETFFPSGLTVPLAFVAFVFCERRRLVSIGPWTSNFLGLAALGMGIYESFGEQVDARLLAGSHFLVYITWIVLFQAKELRQYWWLCALSLLQVAVGSVLTLALGWYGLWLFAYLLLALWTLSLFTLYQGAFEFGALQKGPASTPGAPRERAPTSSAAGEAGAGLQSRFFEDRHSAVQNSIQQDFPGRWIFPRFVVGVMALSFAGLGIGLGLFLLVPRVWLGGGATRQSESISATSVTGFSSEVRLGALGEILESTDRVMQVRLFDNASNEPISLDRFAARQGLLDPLFRGSVLDGYESGRWRSRSGEGNPAFTRGLRGADVVRQEYVLEMPAPEVLFAMQPIRGARLDTGPQERQQVLADIETGVLFTRVEGRERLKYFVYSPSASATGTAEPASRWFRRPVLPRYQELPEGQKLKRLTELAQALTVPERLPGDESASTARRMALALESHLRDSGEYTYSLSMAVDDPTIDPVEDFLFNRKRGHCEYFASALALMLRSVQIPSRLVTGFKGADFNSSEQFYEVQQRHAHAWVEAYVDRSWIVLDPTPGTRDEVVRDVATRAGFFKKAANSLSSFWSNYVVSLSLNRQQESLYDPLQGSVSRLRAAVTGLTSAVEWAKQILSSPEAIFSPRGALLILSLLAALILFIALVRRLWQHARGRTGRFRRRGWLLRFVDRLWSRLTGRPDDPAGVVVAFYEEFQRLLDAAGFSRRGDQTQREFALEIERSLEERLAPAGLSRFPSELAELFYRVRFGSLALEAAQEREVESRLDRLRGSLVAGNVKNGRTASSAHTNGAGEK